MNMSSNMAVLYRGVAVSSSACYPVQGLDQRNLLLRWVQLVASMELYFALDCFYQNRASEAIGISESTSIDQ